MKKLSKSLLLIALLASYCLPGWSQTPTTEGRDFWVTFLRAADDNPTELKLTISAREACTVTIENANLAKPIVLDVADNSCTEIGTNTAAQNQRLNKAHCYTSTNEKAAATAYHVTATKDISLFAGNYRDKSFDATNVIPTAALLDDYLIQTFPPSDHDGPSACQGSHFAIIAVEDGETIVDFNLTTKTASGKTGAQSTPALKKGQVYYIWTGKGAGDAYDLSGTSVKARNGKKIAVFQGCPHTNMPNGVRDRDHIVSQAMPTAYWGTEFGITASRQHRRDIIAVMAINDGTEVYINAEDGGKQLVHTFDFTKDKKHYWTFEIGEDEAYCTDNENELYGRLPSPLVIDSSCYLSTSCPAGVHLFMVSNRYDNATADGTNICDPAMLWISPIEQVIKEINFSTYKTTQAKNHYMNIVTTTDNVANMTWNGTGIAQYFRPITGKNDYSFARIEIQHGSHNLKGTAGFLAHVYGYGERESYAYSCGSSTIQRGISVNGMAVEIGGTSSERYCVNEEISMKLNMGNNDYGTIVWDFGDGVTYSPESDASNEDKQSAKHIYTTPGWYDLQVNAVYVNACTGQVHSEPAQFSFLVVRPETIRHQSVECVDWDYTGEMGRSDTVKYDCDSVVITEVKYQRHSQPTEYSATYADSAFLAGRWWTKSSDVPDTLVNSAGCDSVRICHLTVITSLKFSVDTIAGNSCAGENVELPYVYTQGDIGEAWYVNLKDKKKTTVPRSYLPETVPDIQTGTFYLPTSDLEPGIYNLEFHITDKWASSGDIVGAQVEYTYPIELTVYYPEDVFTYEFNNVLAVWKKGYGGNVNPGWDFVRYQWYRNDTIIEGATASVYHTEEPFTLNDEYYVVLTRRDGFVLRTCAKTIDVIDDYNPPVQEEETEEPGEEQPDQPGPDNQPAPAKAPAKVIRNQQMFIIHDGAEYNMFGQKIR